MADLPFLKNKITSVIMANRHGPQPVEDSDAPMRSAAEDLMMAIHQKDIPGLIKALKSAHILVQIETAKDFLDGDNS